MWTSPEGKSYVGQTIRPDERMRRHKNCEGNNKLFHSAIKKFGWLNFSYEVLHSGIESKSMLDDLEQQEIEARGTLHPSGYNAIAGEYDYKNHRSRKGKPCGEKKVYSIDDDISFKSIAEAARYYGFTNSSISAVCTGKRVSHKGKRFAFLIDFEKHGYKLRHKKINKKKVVRVQDGKEFDSVTEAAKSIGVKLSSVSDNLNGRSKTVKGFSFVYKETA